MSKREHVTVEGVDCILFPIPADTENDQLKDTEFFLKCAYARLNALSLDKTTRSRNIALALQRISEAGYWFDCHLNRVRNGIPIDDDPLTMPAPAS